jgi:membrane fusion protein, multidrug efflux system
MKMNGFDHPNGPVLVQQLPPANIEKAASADTSGSERQDDLREEVSQLRLEVEDLLERQRALQRTPLSNNTGDRIDAEDEESESQPRSPDHDGRFRRHPVRLIVAVLAGALLCLGGSRFWNYLQSYEWTDDAEIDGHLDPVSTRINDTVVRVYVENTYHVRAGQTLVDLDPRDYQVAVENAEANLAQAEQGVKAAQQNYDLAVANLHAAIATNFKAQLDVKHYGELLKQAVIPRETDDEIVMTGRVDAAAVNSDRAEVGATVRMVDQAQAAVQAAQAALDQAKLNLSYTHIVAPAT